MRLFNIAFAFYILLLALMPCTDTFVSHEDESKTEACAHANGEEHGHEHEDSCTPLCACNCCGTVIAILTSEKKIVADIPLVVNSKEVFFSSSVYSVFNHSIWQPPKI